MPTLSDMPYELLLEIFKYDRPSKIDTFIHYLDYFNSRKVNIQIHKAAVEALWRNHVVQMGFSCAGSKVCLPSRKPHSEMLGAILDSGDEFGKLLAYIRNVEMTVRIPDHPVLQYLFKRIWTRLEQMPGLRNIRVVVTSGNEAMNLKMAQHVMTLLRERDVEVARELEKAVFVRDLPTSSPQLCQCKH